jgi:hypothetical protein
MLAYAMFRKNSISLMEKANIFARYRKDFSMGVEPVLEGM